MSTPSIGITAPSISVPSLPSLNFAPLSILRNGNDFTLTGDLPDLNVKTALLNALKAAFGSGVNLIDKLNIKAGVSSPDFSGLGGLFKAAVDVPDFNFNIEGGTLTLTGTAPSEEIRPVSRLPRRRRGRTSRSSTTSSSGGGAQWDGEAAVICRPTSPPRSRRRSLSRPTASP